MGLGYLRVALYAGHRSLPIANDRVLIKNQEGQILYDLTTDENGTTDVVTLSAPDKRYSQSPNTSMPRFSIVDVETPAFQGYKKAVVHWAEIFDTITTTLSMQLHPVISGESEEQIDEYYIPIKHGVDLPREPQISSLNHNLGNSRAVLNPRIYNSNVIPVQNIPINQFALANDVPMPENITVHLGSPNAYARNVTIPFADYIKNVASSEIYPTWEEAALYSNIYAQISFALNRIFTLWYRSRRLDFDITNVTAFDQAFTEGRCIFDNISQIVDGIFNNFLRRQNRQEPFFASYCNGTTSTCDGLSQWGSQSLAQQGYTPIQILRNYYPDDIQIVESNNFGEQVAIYPGTPLREGSSGENVRLMQLFLNRIHGNYPGIPISIPDGTFGPATRESAIAFQNVFTLIADGIIGKSTWYAIVKIFVAVTNLAEIASQGIRIGIGEIPPTTTIQMGSSGELVSDLQFLLEFISEFYYAIPPVVRTSRFGENTRTAVIEFQKNFGLAVDGIVGPATWQKLYSVYHSIVRTVDISPEGLISY